MTQNKTTPLSERRKLDIDWKKGSHIYYEEDVREAVRRLIGFLSSGGILLHRGFVLLGIKEIFGKELCEEEKQDENI